MKTTSRTKYRKHVQSLTRRIHLIILVQITESSHFITTAQEAQSVIIQKDHPNMISMGKRRAVKTSINITKARFSKRAPRKHSVMTMIRNVLAWSQHKSSLIWSPPLSIQMVNEEALCRQGDRESIPSTNFSIANLSTLLNKVNEAWIRTFLKFPMSW